MIVRRIILILLCVAVVFSVISLGTLYALPKYRTSLSVITRQTLLSTPNWAAEGNQAWAHLGWSVGTAGDVNCDGYSDVIVGVPYYKNGQTDEGCVHVYLGSASGLSATPAWTVEGNQEGIAVGYSVSTAGDINGDGYSDVIVGAPYYDDGETNEGRAYVYLGSASGLSTTPVWAVEGNQEHAWLGYSVGTAGDVNGDGYSDVIVGAYEYYNVEVSEGWAFVYLGSASGLSATPDWTAQGNQEYAYFGYSVGTAGDVNGDGYSDVIIGTPRGHHGTVLYPGCAYVYFGSVGGLSATPDWIVEGDDDYGWFGCSVGTAGDVNGDGYSDIIVGAYSGENGEDDEGCAYVYLGSPDSPSIIPVWAAEGNQQSAWFGWSAGTAGDVNGDGYSDIIVGAHNYDVSQVGCEGRACVYHGSASGPSTHPNWTVQGDQESAFLGFSVGTAGDVNSDGYSDVIISAYNYSNGEEGEGRAYVYLGSNITPPPTPTPTPTPVPTPTPMPTAMPTPTPALGSWEILTPLPQEKSLYGIWGSSFTDVFAVGDMGTILHYDGYSWSIMSGNTTQRLEGIWGSSPTDVFAVGENGTILHYDGVSWGSMDSGTTLPLRGVWGSSSTDVFAVGGWTSDIFHYDGTSWALMYTSAGSFTNRLYDVWGSSSSDVFAVGDDFNPQDGMIMHYDGQSWTLMLREFTTTGFEDVWGSSPEDVFAVGDQGVVKHYNGTGWASMYATMDWLKGVWGSSANNVFAVGGGGVIVRYDGYSWIPMSSGTTNGLQDVWGSSATDAFAVGLHGTILRYQLQQPTPTPSPTPTPTVTPSPTPTITPTPTPTPTVMPSEVWVNHTYCSSCTNDGHIWQFDAFSAIQDGIDAVGSPGTIHVAPGIYYENIILKSGTELLGAGAGENPSTHSIIDGSADGSVIAAIYVDSTTKLQGFTITNGFASFGGGIFCYASSPVITSCTILQNQAVNGGGGIYNYYSSPSISEVQFVDNSTIGEGSMSSGGGLYNSYSSPTLSQCEFRNNSTTHMGGGFYNAENSAPTLEDCTFIGNTATISGGGLCNYQAPSLVVNCTFSGNSADIGGGIYDYSNTSTFIAGCSFSNNSAISRGGGISIEGLYQEKANVIVTNCVFANNTAHNGGGIVNENSHATFVNCMLIQNSAIQRGGGIYTINFSSPLVSNCTFFDNIASEGASTYTFWYSSIEITNSILWGETTDQIHNGDYGESKVSYCDVRGNYGQEEDHNINLNPLFVNASAGDFHLQFASPCIDAGSNAAVISWLTFDFDLAPRVTDGDSNGVAVVDMGADETEGVPAVYYEIRTVSTTGGSVTSPGEPGPFTYIAGVEVSLIAAYDPGYRFFKWTGDTDTVADIFSANTTITMNGNYTVTAVFVASEAWVDDEYTEVGSNDGHTWGFDAFNKIQDAIDVLPAPCIVHVAPGLYYEHIMMKDGLEIEGAGAGDIPEVHSIIDGSGVATIVESVNCSSSTKISNFTVRNGSAALGGGMFLRDSSIYVDNCIFKSNSVTNGFGGAMYVCNSSPVITNCVFEANSAHGYDSLGGALYILGAPTIINCIFVGNSVDNRQGGAIYNAEYSSPTIINCSFFGNSAEQGGALANTSATSQPVIVNCILWGNAPDEIYDFESSLIITYSDIQGGYVGNGNINKDPMFKNSSIGDLRSLGTSPCIDAGDNTAVPIWVATDFEGNPRFFDNPYSPDTGAGMIPIVDMGAYEYCSPTPTPSTMVTGITREVNGDILPGVSITIDGAGTVVSDQNGLYQITVTSTGSKNVVAHKDGFRDQTKNINITGLGQEFTVTCNFQGQYGLIPNAPDMWYALDCVNLWLYPPNSDIGLDMWTALDAVNAWLYPIQ